MRLDLVFLDHRHDAVGIGGNPRRGLEYIFEAALLDRFRRAAGVDHDDLVLLGDRRAGRGRRRTERGHHEVDLVVGDQLFVEPRCGRRIGAVVIDDELDRPAGQPAAGIGLLAPEVEPLEIGRRRSPRDCRSATAPRRSARDRRLAPDAASANAAATAAMRIFVVIASPPYELQIRNRLAALSRRCARSAYRRARSAGLQPAHRRDRIPSARCASRGR